MTKLRWGLGAAAFWIALMLPAAAFASEVYPQRVAEKLGMPCIAPRCTICHTTNPGVAGTANQPFALALKNLGLTGASQLELLDQVLTTAEAQGLDSTDDGDPDIEQLRAGLDPNTGEDACDAPRYGCGARIEPKSRVDALGAWAAIATALTLVALRRRRY